MSILDLFSSNDIILRMNRLIPGLLLPILLIFSFLAFRGLKEQGLLYHDAGAYLLETKFLDEGAQALRTLSSGEYKNSGFWEAMKAKTSGAPPYTSKPGFNLILWAASEIWGLSDSLSAKVTAAAAAVNLLLTFLLARRLTTTLSGIYATAFLVSSVFYLTYARSGLAEQVATVFFLTGVLLLLRSWRKGSNFTLYLVGVCLGYTFACNPWRVLYLLALFLGFDLLAFWWEKKWSWKMAVQRMALMIVGYLTPIVAFQLPYVLLKLRVSNLPFKDYWTYLSEKLGWLGGVVWFKRPGHLAVEYWLVEGPFFAAVILTAWGFLLFRFMTRRRFQDLFLLAFSLLPFIYFSLATPTGETLPRVVSNVIPIASLAVGELVLGIHHLLQEKLKFFQKRDGWLGFLLVTVLLVQAIPRQLNLLQTRSGYREASHYLESTGKKEFMILGMEPVWRFYLGRVAYEPYHRPQSLKALVEKAQARQIEHLLVDFSTLHSKYGCRYTASLLGKQTPLAVFPNPLGGSLPYLLDQLALEGSQEVVRDPLSRKIYIFRIKDIAGATSSVEGPGRERA